jgi:hypothetical protein
VLSFEDANNKSSWLWERTGTITKAEKYGMDIWDVVCRHEEEKLLLAQEKATFERKVELMIESLRRFTLPTTNTEYEKALDKFRQQKIHELSLWLGVRVPLHGINSLDDESDSASENESVLDILDKLDEIQETQKVNE